MDLGFVGKDAQSSSGLSRKSRPKALSKTLNDEEVNAEKAVHAKRQRAGHLGEVRKRRNAVQDLITGPGMENTEVEDSVLGMKKHYVILLAVMIITFVMKKKKKKKRWH